MPGCSTRQGRLSKSEVPLVGWCKNSWAALPGVKEPHTSCPESTKTSPSPPLSRSLAVGLPSSVLSWRSLTVWPTICPPPPSTMPPSNAFALARRLPTVQAGLSSGGTGKEWLKAGLVEWLDFTKPEELVKKQAHVTIFRSPTPAQINALVCWIWIETCPHGAPRGYPKRATPGGPRVCRRWPQIASQCVCVFPGG